MGSGDTLYDRVGGQPFFDRLVDRFYEDVEGDPPLRAQYPDDLGPGKQSLAEFLAQYWGGPPVYSERKGHPRLRLRHMPFTIDADMAQRWLTHMLAAVDDAQLADDDRAEMVAYFEKAAPFMINQGLTLRGS